MLLIYKNHPIDLQWQSAKKTPVEECHFCEVEGQ